MSVTFFLTHLERAKIQSGRLEAGSAFKPVACIFVALVTPAGAFHIGAEIKLGQ